MREDSLAESFSDFLVEGSLGYATRRHRSFFANSFRVNTGPCFHNYGYSIIRRSGCQVLPFP
ncbi:hypothetical protein ACCAA_400038 [Candidatus Accumulibacter aalborgensis]|uniref:Uncharacterized protein n=1 Tax=Candidatus Accumulibacter aalborgensis TaxID=1860102 RepID=A0A1A8XPV3_9PROT|nr:hypothetical protein ACCAA_400038 [Candidatus Accumulibacter aalborgensis]